MDKENMSIKELIDRLGIDLNKEIDHDGPEMPVSMENTLTTLNNAPIKGSGDIMDQLIHLWENPDDFENPDKSSLEKQYEDNPMLLILELGVLFGTNYERVYPTGRNDEWPIPLDER